MRNRFITMNGKKFSVIFTSLFWLAVSANAQDGAQPAAIDPRSEDSNIENTAETSPLVINEEEKKMPQVLEYEPAAADEITADNIVSFPIDI
jgi:hypothetical protein